MRHKKNKLIELNTGMQKRTLVMRNLLTSLVKHGEITTTPKKAKVLKAYADSFFARLMGNFVKYQQTSDVRRESIRFVKDTIFGNDEGKKVVNDLIPQFRSQ
jgi:ribosomal protein L17